MRPGLLFVYWLSSISLLADPISVSILNQTFTTTVSTQGIFLRCSQTGKFSAVCSTQEPTGNPYAPAETYATASAWPDRLYVDAAAGGGLPNDLFALASSNVTDTVLITGGQGTGYLDMVFQYAADGLPASSDAALGVNGQISSLGSPLPRRPLWLVASFTFGQPFTYSIGLSVIGDNLDPVAGLQLAGARVYATQPYGCPNDLGYQGNAGFGFCDDPNFTSADQAFSQLVAPEPGTMSLFGCVVILVLGRRRFRASAVQQSRLALGCGSVQP